MKTKNLKLWYRLGDAGNYENVGNDFSAIIDVLRNAEISGDIGRRACGIITSNYRGCNYISLYWGNDDAEFEALITDQEFEMIKNAFSGGSEDDKA